jgi:hypothetical protein
MPALRIMPLFALLMILLTSCNPQPKPQAQAPKKESHSHDHGSEGEGASYAEGKGITLLEETAQSIGLELAGVAEQPLRPRLDLPAQIYRGAGEPSRTHGGERQGRAYATALLATAQAEGLQPGLPLTFQVRGKADVPHTGRLWRIEHGQAAVLGKVELLLELEDPDRSLAVGDFVETGIDKETSTGGTRLAVPKSAVLRTPMGTFAFVQNGPYLLRTEIETGAEDATHVEVTGGLYEGDTIAVRPVEALYMIELRATKGGGHCH